jgi:hypothetical protein
VRSLAASTLLWCFVFGCGGGSVPPEQPTSGHLHVEQHPGKPIPVSSFQAGSALPVMKSVPFRATELPVLVAPPKVESDARTVPEVAVTRDGTSATLVVPEAEGRLARITVNGMSSQGFGGLRVDCSATTKADFALHVLDIRPDGRAGFTRVEGVFDASGCRAIEHSRVTFEPAVLVPGYLFAYRACSTSPCAANEGRVTFLMPPLAGLESDAGGAKPLLVSSAPFGVATIDPAQGSVDAVTAVVNEAAVRVLFRAPPPWARPGPMVLGIDFGSTTEEREAVGVASFGVV